MKVEYLRCAYWERGQKSKTEAELYCRGPACQSWLDGRCAWLMPYRMDRKAGVVYEILSSQK